MFSQINHRIATAVALLSATVSLAGCGGAGSVSQPAAFAPGDVVDAGTAGAPAPASAPAGPRVFAVGGSSQIVVKTKPGAVLAARPGLKRLRTIPPLSAQVLSLAPGQSMDDALRQLKADPSVAFAEPNFAVRAFDLPGGAASPAPTNDPLFGQQFGLPLIKAPLAWELSPRGAGVTIAIVDTGVDVTHPEFAGKIKPGFAVADASPTLTPPEKDDNGHGTHCAGIAAAITGNGFGIAGVAPGAGIMPVKVLSAAGSGSDAGVAEGITWAADHGAQVISLSLGGPDESQIVAEAVKHALAKGASVVAAMGNDGNGQKSFPAAFPGVIAVGAVDKNGKVANFSQFGSWISVAAPGVGILSTFPTYKVALNDEGFPQNFATLDGTSMATPHVAGVAALMQSSFFRVLPPARLKQQLEQSSQRSGGFDVRKGWGIVDASKAVQP